LPYTLYIVGTPIGNLEDVTLRCLRILSEVSLIAAEDTRVTRKLLSRYGIHTPLTSFNNHNWKSKLPKLLEVLKEANVALVTDAGTPNISDPGYELTTGAVQDGAQLSVIPGPSALTAAVSLSTLRLDRFVFMSFLPRRTSQRRRILMDLAEEQHPIVVFESPHRLQACLKDILGTLGDRLVTVCRELTKLHEEVYRGTIGEALDHFSQPRGEFTLIIQGATNTRQVPNVDNVRQALLNFSTQGFSAKDSISQVSSLTSLSRRDLYKLWLTLPKSKGRRR
jgi:16S rRNA (cytidine1402-2'-O)-methyltransferase